MTAGSVPPETAAIAERLGFALSEALIYAEACDSWPDSDEARADHERNKQAIRDAREDVERLLAVAEAAKTAVGCAEYALMVTSEENTADAFKAIEDFRAALALTSRLR